MVSSCPKGVSLTPTLQEDLNGSGWQMAEAPPKSRPLTCVPPQACPGRTTWPRPCARPLGKTAPASTAASGTFTSTASSRTSARCPCKPASCQAVSRATRRCVPTARASPAASRASPVSVRRDGPGPSVTRGPMTPVWEISKFGLLGSYTHIPQSSKQNPGREGRRGRGRRGGNRHISTSPSHSSHDPFSILIRSA